MTNLESLAHSIRLTLAAIDSKLARTENDATVQDLRDARHHLQLAVALIEKKPVKRHGAWHP